MRWRRTSKAVLVRDLCICRIVAECPERATVADHVIPSTLDMPDALFFGMSNLRAGCRPHNIARGLTEPLEAGASLKRTAVVTRDYSR